MQLELIDAAAVRRILTMPACIEVLDRAMRAVSRGELTAPPRLFVPFPDSDASLGLMPGIAAALDVFGAKIVSLTPKNPARDLPAVQGFIALFERETGTPVALIEGAIVTAIRTAAASGLATRELARADAKSHGIFGTGVQAVSHIDAVAAVRNIERIVIWGRNSERASTLAAQQAERTGLDVVATDDPQLAAACDVISTVTGARKPILKGRWLRPGAHVNVVGAHEPTARETDSALIAAARVYVDSLDAAMKESGDVLIPLHEGAIEADRVIGEIGQLLEGAIAGRRGDDETTVYKSLGVVAQDLFAADYIFREYANTPATDRPHT